MIWLRALEFIESESHQYTARCILRVKLGPAMREGQQPSSDCFPIFTAQGDMDMYEFQLYQHNDERRFEPGEAVYVWLKSQYNTGRAVVIATPESLPADSPFVGRYLVRFTQCGSTAHVRPDRLLPVYQQQHVQQQRPASASQQPSCHPAASQHEQQGQHQGPQCPADQPLSGPPHRHPHKPLQGLVLVVASTLDYRRLARSQVQSWEGVLELGCSFGVCSKTLQEHAAWLHAVDHSPEVLQEARRRYPHISFFEVDVLEQQQQLLQLARHTTGSWCQQSSLCEPMTLADAAAGVPGRTHCVTGCTGSSDRDCGGINATVGSDSACQICGSSSSSSTCKHHTTAGTLTSDNMFQPCSALDSSCVRPTCQSSQPADALAGTCSVVFADIGGNRQLESLVKLIPWILSVLGPRLLVVKSEQLAAAASQQLAAEQQQRQQHKRHDCVNGKQLVSLDGSSSLQDAARAHSSQPLLNRAEMQCCDRVIGCVQQWWQQLEQRCSNPASLAEPWFIAARAAGFGRNPMRYPQRLTADGTRICRPHNYDGDKGCCKRDTCTLDHEHCHHCLQPGHKAIDCPIV